MTTSNFSCAGTQRLVTHQSDFLAFFSALSCMRSCICLIQQISYVSCGLCLSDDDIVAADILSEQKAIVTLHPTS